MQCNSTTAACPCMYICQSAYYFTLPTSQWLWWKASQWLWQNTLFCVHNSNRRSWHDWFSDHYYICQSGQSGRFLHHCYILCTQRPWRFIFVLYINQFSCHSSSMASCLPYVDHVPKIKLLIPGRFAIYVEVLTLHHSNSNISLATKIY